MQERSATTFHLYPFPEKRVNSLAADSVQPIEQVKNLFKGLNDPLIFRSAAVQAGSEGLTVRELCFKALRHYLDRTASGRI